jgi:Purple acid Phosphatase, N-terminal domain/TAT (twin-arginine translocation) pathway signal sequence
VRHWHVEGAQVTEVTRRSFLKVAAATGAAATASSLIGSKAWAAPGFWKKPGATDASVADQIHIQYGADAAAEMTVSWHTATSVSRPRLRLGTVHGGWGREIPAETRSYVDGLNGIETICQHARATRLAPNTTYIYEVLADGATPVQGSFSTAPRGRVPFRFTSVGDLATPNTSWSKSSLNAATTVQQVEQFKPLFHLHNADLSYANNNTSSQPQVWADFMNNIQTAAGRVPWMTALGNHESEWANGPLGYASYQTRFDMPGNGSPVPGWRGNWYSFQVGSALFVSLDANHVHYANDGSANPANPAHAVHRRLQQRRPDGLAGAHPGRGAPRPGRRLDHRVPPPADHVLVVRRSRRRPRHPPGVPAPVRRLRRGPGAVRPRPRLRADLHGARHRPGHRPCGPPWSAPA